MENPQRMAKWADLTETLANQINEASRTVAGIKDKASFILLIPPPKNGAPAIPAALEELAAPPPVGPGPEDSALSAKLSEISGYLQLLNDDLRELSDRIDV